MLKLQISKLNPSLDRRTSRYARAQSNDDSQVSLMLSNTIYVRIVIFLPYFFFAELTNWSSVIAGRRGGL